jgi:GT2 family glycosyltransferase
MGGGRAADNAGMNVSVLIPTRGRADRLSSCLRLLSGQEWIPGDEVVVAIDGPEAASARAAVESFESGVCALRVEMRPREGYIAARHALTPTLRGDVLVSLNDDVRPGPGFIAAHRGAVARDGAGAAFVGYSPFVAVDRPTLIDRVVSETSWVFFYDRMLADGDPGRDWGFRHLFGLNFSARLDVVLGVGGFTAMPGVYGYDDIELGHRLTGAGLGVRFLRGAEAPHDHRLSAEDLLGRERLLGESAWHYARARPAFAAAVFGRDILSEESVAALRSVRVDPGERASFVALGDAAGGDDPGAPERVLARYRGLKRACWASGVVGAWDQGCSAAA